ncbi:hypothetical protein [Treponema sp. C6A8]|uniref:hypothetical protein n=1 Tax=Treponema sp. C6A8 TaxID=1410609 RepID=UPI00048989C7|nr:hypothetical protein [Treponema sp. C6A8]
MFRVISKIFESVYNEFGKLDSLEEKLSPKLKALLAAGLIGTASLGMQSCAQPTDDNSSYPPALVTDNNTGGKTTVTLEELCGNDETHIARLATCNTNPVEEPCIILDAEAQDYKYTGNGFTEITKNEQNSGTYYVYSSGDYMHSYHIPKDKKTDFDKAIASYKAAHLHAN